jgi:hypothetical protein
VGVFQIYGLMPVPFLTGNENELSYFRGAHTCQFLPGEFVIYKCFYFMLR